MTKPAAPSVNVPAARVMLVVERLSLAVTERPVANTIHLVVNLAMYVRSAMELLQAVLAVSMAWQRVKLTQQALANIHVLPLVVQVAIMRLSAAVEQPSALQEHGLVLPPLVGGEAAAEILLRNTVPIQQIL